MHERRPAMGLLIHEAAERAQTTLGAGIERVRASMLILVQAALAAGGSWVIAHDAIGHRNPFFAPIASVISLGLTLGQARRRAVELTLGVAVGIGVADFVVRLIGHGAWQLVLIVLATMTLAVFLGSSPIFVTQAAVSAILVVTIPAQTAGGAGRFVDALVGGAVALLVAAVVPVNPLRLVQDAAQPLLAGLEGVLRDVAGALDDASLERGEAALARARRMEALADRFRKTLEIAREMSRITVGGRGQTAEIDRYAATAAQLDLAVRNIRVLARAATRAIELGDRVPAGVADALRDLAGAVVEMAGAAGGDIERAEKARAAAIQAAAKASAVLEQSPSLSVSVIVGQVRSIAVDLLRALGLGRDEARAAVRDAGAPSG